MTRSLNIFSFFSGAGLLDLGFEHEGYNVVYVNENHEPFLAAYKYSRETLGLEPPRFGYESKSITKFYDQDEDAKLTRLVSEIKKNDALVGFIGGPPCPDFSVGGKNRGQHGDRGKLSKTYVDLICKQQPDFFLFENVKGLWKTKRHRSFYNELKNSLSLQGYFLTERLVNSIEYGVPQDRARIILLGFRSSALAESHTHDSFQESRAVEFPWLKFVQYPDRTALDYNWPKTSPFSESLDLPCPPNIPAELTVEHWFRRNHVNTHPNAEHCFKPRAGLARFRTVHEGDDSKKSFKRLHRWRYSPTAAYGNNEVHLHPYKARRISVAEALAIQSLPPGFALPPQMSLSNMFKTVGNGVPYLAAKMIARSIKCFLGGHYEQTHGLRHSKSNFASTSQPGLPLY